MLIVDEAQGLSPHVLEEIRLLSNFESNTAKQLQIVLTGQPELREVLNNPDLRQLKQRIALRCVIKPLPNVEETDRYITSRLLVAGAERTDIFSPEAVDYIFRCSDGIPRNINNLCDNALLGVTPPATRRSAARLSKTWPTRSTCCPAPIAAEVRGRGTRRARAHLFLRGPRRVVERRKDNRRRRLASGI